MKAPKSIMDYCRPYRNYFYDWEEGTDVLAIPNGGTICYRPFLFELLETLSENRVPSLGALLLTVIATGPNAPELLLQAERIIREARISTISNLNKEGIAQAFRFLEILSKLPVEYRMGSLRKQVIQAVFGAISHNLVSGKKFRRVIAPFLPGGINFPLEIERERLMASVLLKDLDPLILLADKFPDTDSILQAVADIPMPEESGLQLEEGLSDNVLPDDYIEALVKDPDTFHVGSLVRRIWSGLSIPLHSRHPSPQPLGGVSDLSNRGQPDRLLISEFAHDDLLFLSRLANGEALYINRETPPQTDRLQRILLIDSSLQTWGTPRSIAWALTIALAKHPKTDIACTAYVVGGDYRPAAFGSIHELIKSLQLLDTDINAAAGLRRFFIEELPAQQHEVIFISTPEGLKAPALQGVLRDWIGDVSYCITATVTGAVSVQQKRGGGFRTMQSFNLPLAELWQRPLPSKQQQETIPEWKHLTSYYPILFPNPPQLRQLLQAQDGSVFAITTERSVLQQVQMPLGRKGDLPIYNQRGWLHLWDKLPAGNCQYEIAISSGGEYLLLVHLMDHWELQIINLSTGHRASTRLETRARRGTPQDFLFRDDSFMTTDGWKYTLTRSSQRHDAPAIRVTKTGAEQLSIYDTPALRSGLLHAEGSLPVWGSVLKNLKRCVINTKGELVINQTRLALQTEGTIKFIHDAERAAATARAEGKDWFAFMDGSTVTLNRNGMLILESGSPDIDAIYVPSVLETELGVATKDFYSGAPFFRPPALSDTQVLRPATFYQQFIIPFTEHILRHAASS